LGGKGAGARGISRSDSRGDVRPHIAELVADGETTSASWNHPAQLAL
jgi:hypothetical protein